MLTKDDIDSVILREIRGMLLEVEDSPAPESVTREAGLHDIGVDSLMLARLIAQLQSDLGADPFTEADADISAVRSVGDLIAVYQQALARKES